LKTLVTLNRSADSLVLRKTARICDLAKATDNYLERIEFKTSAGEMAKIELAPSTVSDPRLFAKHLRDAGAILPTNKSSLKTLLEATAASICKLELVYAARTGWTKNGKAFVRPDRVVGKSSTNILGFRRSKPGDQRGMIERGGSVESWKSTIGTSAKSSSVMMFTISAAFAAALLKMTRTESFAFCLFAESRSGKTLATLAAGSVIGTGTVGQMLDWNQTKARIEEQLPEHNDCLVAVDDLMSLDGTNQRKYARVQSSAFIFALGAGMGRHSSYSQSNSESWRTILLTSNEYSIRDLAGLSRLQRSPGETVRLIDLPATFDGATDIFDRVAPLNDREQLPWERLFKACSQNQGHVFESFLAKLIARKPKVLDVIKRHRKVFVNLVQHKNDGKFARDIARKFALVYAAGELAIEFRLVPWKSAGLRDAISKCYRASRDLLPDDGVILRSGFNALRAYCKSLPIQGEIDKADFGSIDGFRVNGNGYRRCLVKGDKFYSIFETTSQAKLVTDWLIADKRVRLARTWAGSPKMKDQHIWPDGQRHRSLEIFWGDKRPLLERL
jgi:Domain of unknown function (DUF927)